MYENFHFPLKKTMKMIINPKPLNQNFDINNSPYIVYSYAKGNYRKVT